MPYSKKEKAKIKTQQFREQHQQENEANGEENAENNSVVRCSVPSGCLLNNEPVNIHDPNDVAKVVCNNPDCTNGEFMHRECFNVWEDEVLTFLRSSGRARSWSEKQRRQNLWTKKGYDLAWKACSCLCAKGHLRKDLNWIPPKNPDDAQKKIRKKKKSGDKPSINTKTIGPLQSPNNGKLIRQSSTSSTENHSPPSSADYMSSPRSAPRKTSSRFEFPISGNGNMLHQGGHGISSVDNSDLHRARLSSGGNYGLADTATRTVSPLTTNNNNGNMQRFTTAPSTTLMPTAVNTNVNAGVVAPTSNVNNNGSSVLFPNKPNIHLLRRIDFTSFKNALPSHKLNSYHIRMDDDNDDIRAVILTTLSTYTTSFMICTLCGQHLLVFDKYPLIDGTFFLTPQRHNDRCMQVYSENKTMYLSAVCVNCLAGGQNIICKSCKARWDGSHHQLGTMYKYDIFAARPCCPNRVSCKHCNQPVIDIRQGMNYFSEYSQVVQCPHCGVSDYHFVKPLTTYELIPNH
ncbi:headcase protein homolog [Ptychodera flava]|uniref:headcase protein homolog n=1 Tax=Ptychodera flava TaxID=63121 RepID=UPI003969F0F9